MTKQKASTKYLVDAVRAAQRQERDVHGRAFDRRLGGRQPHLRREMTKNATIIPGIIYNIVEYTDNIP